MFESKNIKIYNEDVINLYDEWEKPVVIMSDGPYGIGGYPGDPLSPNELREWYKPHIKKWTELSTPLTTLWFWNTELGWANVHNEFLEQGWEFVNCHIWDKGKEHIAGNVNTKTMRKFPVVTEVCVQYVKKALFKVEDKNLSMQDWLRYEWKRTGLPFSKTNEACGVANAASRKYFTNCHLWYYPPSEAFEKIVNYANLHGKKEGYPYFSVNGINSLTRIEWGNMRAKFKCEFGIYNVWREPPLNGKERLKNGSKSLHLNQKPLKFMKNIIQSSSDENDVVWEPFGGLFSCLIAVNQLNRKGYGAEITYSTYEFGKKRLEDEISIKEYHLVDL
ncbi:DNA methyltransferase [Flavobacterium sp. ov086]|uniref:DNA methyltransferase n=1 Tax=Flavobacterium sp. ov086 TaxID=1761785 RepID=UPI000B72DC5C|nr:DNA methyltransferase [Flavobacterium sp. ov086]SNR40490.1 DNA methylase [Flavobacterium sp. ov086]